MSSLRKKNNPIRRVDWLVIGAFLTLVVMGWLNIFAVTYDPDTTRFFDFGSYHAKQGIWVVISLITGALLLQIDPQFYRRISFGAFLFTSAMLAAVLVFGKEINGARSWFAIGGFTLQPSEFAKIGTTLAICQLLDTSEGKIRSFRTTLRALLLMVIPMGLIMLQPDMGSVLVFAGFIFVLYREGLSGNFLLLGLLSIVLFVLALLFDLPSMTIAICLVGGITYSVMFLDWRFLITAVSAVVVPAVLFYQTDLPPVVLIGYYVVLIVGKAVSNYRKREMRNRIQRNLILGVMLVAIGFTFSVGYIFNNVLQEHQRTRITLLLGEEDKLKEQVATLREKFKETPKDSPEWSETRDQLASKRRSLSELQTGVGWNLNQSKIAIGSGGFLGKGFLQGTQTKFDYVPEQRTDFIFCTVGEEWGFLGSFAVISVFLFLLIRLVIMAERQRSVFSRVFGYSVASILFFHFAINIGMTIGLAPVIGIPLPFFSYGGSSLWAFSILLFIFVRLDATRKQVLR